MSTSKHEYSALCRDAFALLQGAIEISYKDGDTWRLEDGQREHPLVNRLRAAAVVALTEDPPVYGPEDLNANELIGQLKAERQANENLRDFLIRLEDMCRAAGMSKNVRGHEVLTWLDGRLTASSNPPSR